MIIDIIYKTVNHQKKKMGKVVNYTKYKKSSVPNEANLEGKGWQSRLFTILLILTWEMRYPPDRGINRKRGASFGSCSLHFKSTFH